MAGIEKYMPRCRIFLLDGEKFQTNLLVLFLDLPLKRETATKTALLAEVLKQHDRQEAAIQAESLYGALWDVSVVKKGDRQLLLFSLETLKAVDLSEALDFWKERILHITLEEKEVNRQKKVLRRKLQALRDDKRAFAQKRVSEETAEGTAYGISADGDEEDLEEISRNGLQAWYEEILGNAEVNIFFCGDRMERKKILSLREDFSGSIPLRRRLEEEYPKNGPRFLQEKADMEQARLGMGFYFHGRKESEETVLLFLQEILGGSADSLLFQEIREKEGLCYDVRAYLEPMTPYLFVEAGIQKEDAKKTGKLVLQCLERLKEESVSVEILQQVKEKIKRKWEGLSDHPWAMVDFFAERVLRGQPLTTEHFLRRIERMETEDIIRGAKNLELKTVYLLAGKEERDGD